MEEKNNQVDSKSEINNFIKNETKTEGKKSKRFALIICIVATITAIIGVSFAVWTYSFTGANNSLSTGSISLELLESSNQVINMSNFLPIGDNTGKALSGTGNKFDFAVTSTTQAAGTMTYSITIAKQTADSGYTLLANNQVKFYLTKFTGTTETQVVAPTLLSTPMGTSGTSGNLATGLTHSHSGAGTISTKYRFRMWVDKDVNASSWTSSTKLQYKVKLGVSGSLSA